MKVTVIIPVKNGMPFLAETAAALIRQTFRDFEVLVVDDGSHDGTCAFVRSIGDDRFRLLKNAGSGCAAAFNTGLAEARGELIMRCDADDLYPPRRLEQQVAWMEEHPKAGVVSGYMGFIWADGRPIVDLRGDEKAPVQINAELAKGIVRSHHCAMAYRTAVVREIGGMRPWFTVCEDVDFLVRMSEACTMWHVDQKAYTARLRPNSLSRSVREEMVDWYHRQIESFRQERLATGRDRLDAGNPPSLPSWSEGRHQQNVRLCAARMLIGAAWHEVEVGRTGESLRYSMRSIRYDPMNWRTWWNATALGVKLVRSGRKLKKAAV